MDKMKFKAIHVNKLDDDTIKEIRIWRNKPFVRQNMFTQHEISEEEHNKYIESIKNNDSKGLFVFYLDDKPFGVYQYSIDKSDSSVFGGNYLIDEEYQLLGYGAIQIYFIGIIINKYFDVKIARAEIIDTNEKALRLMRGRKDSVEECLKNNIMIDGIPHDVYRFTHDISTGKREDTKMKKVVHYLIDDEYEIII